MCCFRLLIVIFHNFGSKYFSYWIYKYVLRERFITIITLENITKIRSIKEEIR